MTNYKKEDINEVENNNFMNLKRGFWVSEFITLFGQNWNNPENQENIYYQYMLKIESRDFDSLPQIAYSEQFVNMLKNLIDPQYMNTLLSPSLSIIYSFYIHDTKLDITPLMDIFNKIREVFEMVDDECRDQMLKILAYSVLHSDEIAEYIYNLFPIDYINNIYENNNDFSSAIATLVYGYSLCHFEAPIVYSLLRISVNLCVNSVTKPKFYIIDPTSFHMSIRAITNISTHFPDITLVLCNNDLKFDMFLENMLFNVKNETSMILSIILSLFSNCRSFQDNIIIPKISYSTILSFISPQAENKDEIDSTFFAESILCYQLFYLKSEDLFKHIYEKEIISRMKTIYLNNASFKLKVNTVQTFHKIFNECPPIIISQANDLKIGQLLIDDIDRETPSLTLKILKCLYAFISKLISLGIDMEEINDSFINNPEIYEIEDNQMEGIISDILDLLQNQK